MNKSVWIGIVVGLGLVVGTVAWYRSQTQPPLPPPPDAPMAPELEPPAEQASPAEPLYPLPEPEAQAEAAPLPDIEQSDVPLTDALVEEFGKEPVEAFLVPDKLVRRIVATVHSLDRDPVPLRLRPMRQVSGAFIVEEQGDAFFIAEENAQRYQPVLQALRSADAEDVASIYVRYYPLFQKAHEELGYPDRYFNDRVIAVIDHLLKTPEIKGPIALVRPKVLYEFADPELEDRSWGQKALIRMGPENAAAVKAKLREIREAIVAKTAKG